MKAQINGKRYDTETANFLTITKWTGIACAVYFKKTGEIFLQDLENSKIVVLTADEQEQIQEITSIKERIREIKAFSMSSKIQINPFIRESTKGKLEELEQILKLSASEIVDNAIINEHKDYERKKAERMSAIDEIKKRISGQIL